MGTERMTCCGALTRTYGDAGHRTHAYWCQYATTTPGPDEQSATVPADPAESRMMAVAVETLFARGLWMAYCNETGMNEWARNEGQVSDGEMLPLSEAQAVRIGLLSRS